MRQYIATTATITAELSEIRAKLELLERNDDVLRRDGEDNLKAINDMSEDIRKDIDILYTAIAEMSAKSAEEEKPRRRIGYRLAGED